MNKGKIGIVTMYGYTNYGNRLQNYAIQQLLTQRGYQVETIVCIKSRKKEYLKKVRDIAFGFLGTPFSLRKKRFRNFCMDMVPTRFIYSTDGLIPARLASEYDFFVTGSDQVWNPELRLKEKDNFFLRFARREQRICISPSIAAQQIPNAYRNEFLTGLQGFPFLCCREASGAEIITILTQRTCEHLIDPTLTISGDEWRKLSKPVQISRKYVLLFFLGSVSSEIHEMVNKVAKQQNIEIVELSSKKCKYYAASPQNFLWLIDNATLVITDSFHAAAFSINFNTPFYVFARRQQEGVENRMSSRIESLTKMFGLENRFLQSAEIFPRLNCDFSKANLYLEEERIKFSKYLDKCLNQKQKKTNCLPDITCTGCTACASKCPQKCLKMQVDAEGFLRPVVHLSACINCGICRAACPVLNRHTEKKEELEIYGAWQKDEKAINSSSSGAVFPLLAQEILAKGGVVYGAAFDEDFSVKHIRAETLPEVRRLLTSKYVQSEMGDMYLRVGDDLKTGKLVLFSGTPCQIAGLNSYLQKAWDNLYLVDFICHGVPSPALWKEYLQEIKSHKLSGEKIRRVNFRAKLVSWEQFSLLIEGDTCRYAGTQSEDPYLKGFLRNLTLRPSCYQCKFKGAERASDITLADFWGASKIWSNGYNPNGTSMVLVHTLAGKTIWKKISIDLCTQQFLADSIIGKVNSAMIFSPTSHPNRKVFFNAMKQEAPSQLLNRLAILPKCSFARKGIDKVKRMMKRLIHKERRP